MRAGDRSRCLQCGGRIVLIHDPRVISLNTGVWVHVSAIRRFAATHPAVGPTGPRRHGLEYDHDPEQAP